MKPRGRRRKFVEIIPEIPGVWYDRERDIYVKLPIMTLTDAQREAIGEFASLQALYRDPTRPEVVEQIAEIIRRPRDLIQGIRLLLQARNMFLILVSYGYPYEDLAEHFDRGVGKILRLCLVRHLLSGQVGAEQREEIEAALVSLTSKRS
jgi:hypothetical protein